MRPKIVILVENGKVSGVYFWRRMNVVVVDMDDLKADGKDAKECADILSRATEGLVGSW